MTDAIHGSRSPEPIGAPTTSANARASSAIPFRAMLDQLERSANSLSRTSESEIPREKLGDVVQEARASLEQVLSLKERLLEEWRAAQRGGGAV